MYFVREETGGLMVRQVAVFTEEEEDKHPLFCVLSNLHREKETCVPLGGAVNGPTSFRGLGERGQGRL